MLFKIMMMDPGHVTVLQAESRPNLKTARSSKPHTVATTTHSSRFSTYPPTSPISRRGIVVTSTRHSQASPHTLPTEHTPAGEPRSEKILRKMACGASPTSRRSRRPTNHTTTRRNIFYTAPTACNSESDRPTMSHVFFSV